MGMTPRVTSTVAGVLSLRRARPSRPGRRGSWGTGLAAAAAGGLAALAGTAARLVSLFTGSCACFVPAHQTSQAAA